MFDHTKSFYAKINKTQIDKQTMVVVIVPMMADRGGKWWWLGPCKQVKLSIFKYLKVQNWFI